MNESLIYKVINRSNRNLLLLSLLGIIVVLVLFFFNLRYFYNFVAGPFDITQANLVGLASAEAPQQYWLNVTGEEMVDTGIEYVTTSKSGSKTVDYTYYALLLDEKLLLMKVPGEPIAEQLLPSQTGWLSPIDSEENVKVVQDLEKDVPAVKGMFLPFKMETGDFRTNGFLGLGVGAVGLLLCGWGLVTVAQRSANPTNHPVLRSLARFGPVDYVVSRIDAEMSGVHPTIGKLHLAPTWLVYAESANILATRYEDIVWVYKHVTTHRSYGVAVSKTYTAMVCDRFGVKLNLVAGNKEAAVDEMLSALVSRAPWAQIGYAPELEAAWNKDRNGFIQDVMNRKGSA